MEDPSIMDALTLCQGLDMDAEDFCGMMSGSWSDKNAEEDSDSNDSSGTSFISGGLTPTIIIVWNGRYQFLES